MPFGMDHPAQDRPLPVGERRSAEPPFRTGHRDPGWWPAPVAGLGALALYALTLAPGLTWRHSGADGGDLLAAALTRGVPHPTGYPVYQLLLRAAVAIYPGEPARAGNWLSALCAAAAVAVLADLARRMLPDHPWRGTVALIAGLAWATSPTFWSQAVLTEVYSLNALFVALLLWLAWYWREAIAGGGTGWRWTICAGFVFGLGLGNHISLALMLPGLAAWCWANRQGLGGVSKRPWAIVLAMIVLGFGVYIYLPLSASGNPPINWGDPRTPEGFWWVLSARIYRPLFFGVSWNELPLRLAKWAGGALGQLAGGPWGAMLAFIGLWWLDRHDHAWWRATGLVALAYSLYGIGYRADDYMVYLIPVWGVCALWLASGLSWGLQELTRWVREKRSATFGRPALVVACALLLLFPAAALVRYWPQVDLSGDHEARDFVASVLAEAELGAVILTATDRPTFSLWYALDGKRLRPDLTSINVNLYPYAWYQQSLVTHHPFLLDYARHGELPPLEQLVPEIGRRRPLYRAEALNVTLSGFREQPVGTLVRMEPAAQ